MKFQPQSFTRSGERQDRSGKNFRIAAVAAAVALSLGAITVIAKTTPTLPDSSPLSIEQSTIQTPPSLAGLIENVQPAVVNITVETEAKSGAPVQMPEMAMPDNPQFQEFFERFFKYSPDQPRLPDQKHRVKGVGSGFIVTPDGYIVTNSHVIEDAGEIQVVLNDGSRIPAKVRGRDAKTDLALLKIDSDRALPYVTFGDSDKARPGDWVVAIGNPFGLGGTATTGIISARGRDINSGPYDDYLQIDAPINRGNSGGPLFDLSGRVIGVNTAIYSPNGANVGIGFAVPATQARSVISQLMQSGQVQRGWLGVHIQKLDQELADSMGLKNTKGALVSKVNDGSPAARAGIKTGDVIVAFNGRQIDQMRELPRLVADVSPGEKTTVGIWRKGIKHQLEVSVDALPSDPTLAAKDTEQEAAEGGRLGVSLASISDELRGKLKLVEGVEGAVVVEVESGSPAEREGLRPGDVIVQAGSKPVATPQDVVGAVQAINPKQRLLLLINRQGNQRFVTVQLG